MSTKIVLDDRGKEAAAAQLVDRKGISLFGKDKCGHDDGYSRARTIIFNVSAMAFKIYVSASAARSLLRWVLFFLHLNLISPQQAPML